MKFDYASLPEIDASLEARLIDRLKNSSVNAVFGFEIASLKDRYCKMTLTYREEVTNGVRSKGTIHGGVVAALADTASAFALSTCYNGAMSFATVDLHVNFLARAQSTIYAHAMVIRKGSRLNVVDVQIEDSTDQLVATASINFILTKPSPL